MRRYAIVFFAKILLVSSILASPSFASEIFYWVDEDGVRNFSDWAPEDSNIEVSKLVLSNSNPPGYDPNEDQNSVLEQAERTNDRWAELKEKKEERRKQRLEQERIPQYVDYDYYEYPYYYRPGYYFQPVRPPGFGHRGPFKTQKRQLTALDQLGLLARPRPHSINSSAHLARINAGNTSKANFQPRHPGKGHRPSNPREW
jgi:hypothetical protein